MRNVIAFAVLLLSVAATAYAVDRIILAPSGDLVLDASSGNDIVVNKDMGIGTDSPAHDLDVLDAGSGVTGSMRVGANNSSGANNGTVIINSGGSGNARLQFDYETNASRAAIHVDSSAQNLEFETAGTDRMIVESDGDVGIGVTSATYKLDIADSITGGDYIARIRSTDTSATGRHHLLIENNSSADDTSYTFLRAFRTGSEKFYIVLDGSANNATGTYTTISSDARLKTNVKPLKGALDKIMLLNPVSYDWINPDEHIGYKKVGFLAQEVAAVDPSWTTFGGVPGEKDEKLLSGDRMKTVAVTGPDFMATMVKALQEQQAVISSLKSWICLQPDAPQSTCE
jgi:hypothetical protein